MSRIGRAPITVPAGVTVSIDEANHVTVKGPKGELSFDAPHSMTVKLDGGKPGDFFTETYPIPSEVANLRADGKVRVTFAATSGGLAGGVFDVRLLAD